LGACEVLYGNGDYIKKLAKNFSDPRFEEARSSIRVACNILSLALATEDQMDKDRCARKAFDALFHAARIASMRYLSTEVARWGIVKRMLPAPYKEEFDEMIRKLHMEYFYRGNYPKGELEKEFNFWLNRVRVYVDKLEAEVKIRGA
jgi:hypothetical protein